MRISIIILLFLSSYTQAENWSLVRGKNFFDIKTDLKYDGLYLNYCFVFNDGRSLNCMESADSLLLLESKEGCYITKQAVNSRNSKLFELEICIKSHILEWEADKGQAYLPEKMVFTNLVAEEK